MLNKSTILAAPDLKHETVNVPEWGGDVIVLEMTALDRDRLHHETNSGGEFQAINYAARVLVRCLADGNGKRLFADDEAADLGSKSPSVIDRLFKVASRLNGTDTTVEDVSKNSEPGLTDSLPSDSV